VSNQQLGFLFNYVVTLFHPAGDGLDKERMKALGMGAFARWEQFLLGAHAQIHDSWLVTVHMLSPQHLLWKRSQ
jgi:hypothetical protein